MKKWKKKICGYEWQFVFTVLEADKLQFIPDESSNVHPDVTLKKILLGRPYSLEQYKSLASKTALLDGAIQSGNGNAILGVGLFYQDLCIYRYLQKYLSYGYIFR